MCTYSIHEEGSELVKAAVNTLHATADVTTLFLQVVDNVASVGMSCIKRAICGVEYH
jgi:hypothetical protein